MHPDMADERRFPTHVQGVAWDLRSLFDVFEQLLRPSRTTGRPFVDPFNMENLSRWCMKWDESLVSRQWRVG